MAFHIIVNPAGASGRAWELWKKLERVFRENDSDYIVHRSTLDDSIGDICKRLTSRGEHTDIVVIGGDGSLNDAVNGIVDFENTYFGFVPCGTGNDMERDMGLPDDKAEIIRRLLDGEVKREADIGELTVHDIYEEGKPTKRRFNISSDVGFGAATCAYADRSRLKPFLNKIGLGRLVYLIKALNVCFTSKPAMVKVKCNGTVKFYKRCLSAIVMNHCHEGGGFKFCPDADFTDGKLDICIGNGISKLAFLKVLPNAYKGSHVGMRGIYQDRAEKIEMFSDIPLWVHTDGEVLGMTRKVSMRILPQKLKLLV